MDYYDVLGVSRTASQDEIRKAYKKQSMRHHPDRGGDEDEFKKINEAYQVLSDEQKRAMYDQYGTADPQQQGYSRQYTGGMPPDMEDIFENFFGGGGFDMFGRRHRSQPRNKSLNIKYSITLEEAYNGKKVMLEVPLPSGRKQVIDTEIPAGIESGMTIRLHGMGDDSIPHVAPGDIMLQVNVDNHPGIKRDGIDLQTTLTISVYDLILGTKVKVTHFNDKGFELNIPAGTQPGTKFSMKGLGMPVLNGHGQGTYYVAIKGIVPKNIDDAQRDLIERARILEHTGKDV